LAFLNNSCTENIPTEEDIEQNLLLPSEIMAEDGYVRALVQQEQTPPSSPLGSMAFAGHLPPHDLNRNPATITDSSNLVTDHHQRSSPMDERMNEGEEYDDEMYPAMDTPPDTSNLTQMDDQATQEVSSTPSTNPG